VFDDLNRYERTTHFNGQSTVALDGDRATGESYCLAHHLYTEDGERKLMVASLRYLDTFAKSDGAWLFRHPGTPLSFLQLFLDYYGPAMNAFAAAAEVGQTDTLYRELAELFRSQNRGDESTAIPATFLKVTVVKD